MKEKKEIKKTIIHSESVYIIAILLLSFSVAMLTATDFGISMIVAPAYILSEKIDFLSFGQSEYIIQAILFAVFCIAMKKVKLVYLSSFVTCLIYGAALDLWRITVPMFNPEITVPGSMSLPFRIFMFITGVLLTSFSIALFYRTYFYPQVYDFFVKGISTKYKIDSTKFKIGFDTGCLIAAVIMTLLLFKKFVGVGFGTLIMTAVNGVLIGLFGKLTDKFFIIKPFKQNWADYFNKQIN